ncbi:protein DOWNY MILDEW RESISTANCE 6-like isoform X1 [Nicotiana tomentosiformis]|uniref:protein DOWNY MILDEW RESISTANCE 6-like isoform X1 n=2 Tax=Nicotiana tomentosiformis TaxID=4098 RepID=UPI00051BFA3F|nr:protein DOWNY MILDEW RESISTANCE 6-like isoform X1 [Nicotiana tomentosiformis]
MNNRPPNQLGNPEGFNQNKLTLRMAMKNIPTVDLIPFFRQGSEDERLKVVDSITKACVEYGFFQIVNHGVPFDLTSEALKLAKAFFESPNELAKLKCCPLPNAPVPAGYNKKPNPSYEFNEFLIMLPPGSHFNIFLPNPPQFREVMEELFCQFLKIGIVVESILSECLGLPPSAMTETGISSLLYFTCQQQRQKG